MRIVVTTPAWESYLHAMQFLAGYMTDRELERLDEKLWDRIADLKKFPRGGQFEPYLVHLGEGHRRLVVGNFKVVYRLEGRTVHITDIFDARQDPRKMKV